MDNKRDIDEELRHGAKIISELNTCNKTMRNERVKQTNHFERKSKEWDRERKGWERDLKQANIGIQKFRTHELGTNQ